MRTILLWTLLVLLPFNGLWLVCVDRTPVAPVAAVAQDSAACRQACAVHRATAGGPICLLTADGTSWTIVLFGVAVLPPQAELRLAIVSTGFRPEPLAPYAEPGLAHFSPPPEA
jgi:hypothetical protein